jgi:RNA polymerase sigma-70 factor (ECF subfamily)
MGIRLNSKSTAFRALFDANRQRVRALLVRIVGPQDAEDLTQVTFAKAAQALPTFRDEAKVSTWLHRMAANVAIDWLRSRSVHEAKFNVPLAEASAEDEDNVLRSAAIVDGTLSPEQELAHKDIHDCIRGEIAKLPDRYREVLALSFLGQMNDEEIAKTLGLTPGSARVRLHRARQEFKKIIEARCDFYQNELSCKPSSPDCCSPAQTSTH